MALGSHDAQSSYRDKTSVNPAGGAEPQLAKTTNVQEWTFLSRMDGYDSALGLNSRHRRLFFERRTCRRAVSETPELWGGTPSWRASPQSRIHIVEPTNNLAARSPKKISPSNPSALGSGWGGGAWTSSSTQSGGCARASRHRPCRSRQESWAGHRSNRSAWRPRQPRARTACQEPGAAALGAR